MKRKDHRHEKLREEHSSLLAKYVQGNFHRAYQSSSKDSSENDGHGEDVEREQREEHLSDVPLVPSANIEVAVDDEEAEAEERCDVERRVVTEQTSPRIVPQGSPRLSMMTDKDAIIASLKDKCNALRQRVLQYGDVDRDLDSDEAIKELEKEKYNLKAELKIANSKLKFTTAALEDAMWKVKEQSVEKGSMAETIDNLQDELFQMKLKYATQDREVRELQARIKELEAIEPEEEMKELKIRIEELEAEKREVERLEAERLKMEAERLKMQQLEAQRLETEAREPQEVQQEGECDPMVTDSEVDKSNEDSKEDMVSEHEHSVRSDDDSETSLRVKSVDETCNGSNNPGETDDDEHHGSDSKEKSSSNHSTNPFDNDGCAPNCDNNEQLPSFAGPTLATETSSSTNPFEDDGDTEKHRQNTDLVQAPQQTNTKNSNEASSTNPFESDGGDGSAKETKQLPDPEQVMIEKLTELQEKYAQKYSSQLSLIASLQEENEMKDIQLKKLQDELEKLQSSSRGRFSGWRKAKGSKENLDGNVEEDLSDKSNNGSEPNKSAAVVKV